MFPLVFLALFAAVIASGTIKAYRLDDQIAQHRAWLDKRSVEIVSEAFQMRLARTGSLGTVSLDDIQGADEGLKVRGLPKARIDLAYAGNVYDGAWYFDRLLVYGLDRQNRAAELDLTQAEHNRCALGQGFATAPSWCGPEHGVVYGLIETRQLYSAWLAEETARMDALLHKIARGFGRHAYNTFPDGGLAQGGYAPLCTLGTGYGAADCVGGVMPQCMGVRLLNQTVPVDCSDMLSAWGNPTSYHYVNKKHVAVVSSASSVRTTAGGVTRKIARELRAP